MKKKVRHIPAPELPRIPQYRPGEFISRESAEEILRNAGIQDNLMLFIRLPARVAVGRGAVEFFDILSEQPFPGKADDVPEYCAENGLRPPSWIKQRYVCVKDSVVTLVDVPRKIFIGGTLSEQGRLTAKANAAFQEAR